MARLDRKPRTVASEQAEARSHLAPDAPTPAVVVLPKVSIATALVGRATLVWQGLHDLGTAPTKIRDALVGFKTSSERRAVLDAAAAMAKSVAELDAAIRLSEGISPPELRKEFLASLRLRRATASDEMLSGVTDPEMLAAYRAFALRNAEPWLAALKIDHADLKAWLAAGPKDPVPASLVAVMKAMQAASGKTQLQNETNFLTYFLPVVEANARANAKALAGQGKDQEAAPYCEQADSVRAFAKKLGDLAQNNRVAMTNGLRGSAVAHARQAEGLHSKAEQLRQAGNSSDADRLEKEADHCDALATRQRAAALKIIGTELAQVEKLKGNASLDSLHTKLCDVAANTQIDAGVAEAAASPNHPEELPAALSNNPPEANFAGGAAFWIHRAETGDANALKSDVHLATKGALAGARKQVANTYLKVWGYPPEGEAQLQVQGPMTALMRMATASLADELSVSEKRVALLEGKAERTPEETRQLRALCAQTSSLALELASRRSEADRLVAAPQTLAEQSKQLEAAADASRAAAVALVQEREPLDHELAEKSNLASADPVRFALISGEIARLNREHEVAERKAQSAAAAYSNFAAEAQNHALVAQADAAAELGAAASDALARKRPKEGGTLAAILADGDRAAKTSLSTLPAVNSALAATERANAVQASSDSGAFFGRASEMMSNAPAGFAAAKDFADAASGALGQGDVQLAAMPAGEDCERVAPSLAKTEADVAVQTAAVAPLSGVHLLTQARSITADLSDAPTRRGLKVALAADGDAFGQRVGRRPMLKDGEGKVGGLAKQATALARSLADDIEIPNGDAVEEKKAAQALTAERDSIKADMDKVDHYVDRFIDEVLPARLAAAARAEREMSAKLAWLHQQNKDVLNRSQFMTGFIGEFTDLQAEEKQYLAHASGEERKSLADVQNLFRSARVQGRQTELLGLLMVQDYAGAQKLAMDCGLGAFDISAAQHFLLFDKTGLGDYLAHGDSDPSAALEALGDLTGPSNGTQERFIGQNDILLNGVPETAADGTIIHRDGMRDSVFFKYVAPISIGIGEAVALPLIVEWGAGAVGLGGGAAGGAVVTQEVGVFARAMEATGNLLRLGKFGNVVLRGAVKGYAGFIAQHVAATFVTRYTAQDSTAQKVMLLGTQTFGMSVANQAFRLVNLAEKAALPTIQQSIDGVLVPYGAEHRWWSQETAARMSWTFDWLVMPLGGAFHGAHAEMKAQVQAMHLSAAHSINEGIKNAGGELLEPKQIEHVASLLAKVTEEENFTPAAIDAHWQAISGYLEKQGVAAPIISQFRYTVAESVAASRSGVLQWSEKKPPEHIAALAEKMAAEMIAVEPGIARHVALARAYENLSQQLALSFRRSTPGRRLSAEQLAYNDKIIAEGKALDRYMMQVGIVDDLAMDASWHEAARPATGELVGELLALGANANADAVQALATAAAEKLRVALVAAGVSPGDALKQASAIVEHARATTLATMANTVLENAVAAVAQQVAAYQTSLGKGDAADKLDKQKELRDALHAALKAEGVPEHVAEAMVQKTVDEMIERGLLAKLREPDADIGGGEVPRSASPVLPSAEQWPKQVLLPGEGRDFAAEVQSAKDAGKGLLEVSYEDPNGELHQATVKADEIVGVVADDKPTRVARGDATGREVGYRLATAGDKHVVVYDPTRPEGHRYIVEEAERFRPVVQGVAAVDISPELDDAFTKGLNALGAEEARVLLGYLGLSNEKDANGRRLQLHPSDRAKQPLPWLSDTPEGQLTVMREFARRGRLEDVTQLVHDLATHFAGHTPSAAELLAVTTPEGITRLYASSCGVTAAQVMGAKLAPSEALRLVSIGESGVRAEQAVGAEGMTDAQFVEALRARLSPLIGDPGLRYHLVREGIKTELRAQFDASGAPPPEDVALVFNDLGEGKRHAVVALRTYERIEDGKPVRYYTLRETAVVSDGVPVEDDTFDVREDELVPMLDGFVARGEGEASAKATDHAAAALIGGGVVGPVVRVFAPERGLVRQGIGYDTAKELIAVNPQLDPGDKSYVYQVDELLGKERAAFNRLLKEYGTAAAIPRSRLRQVIRDVWVFPYDGKQQQRLDTVTADAKVADLCDGLTPEIRLAVREELRALTAKNPVKLFDVLLALRGAGLDEKSAERQVQRYRVAAALDEQDDGKTRRDTVLIKVLGDLLADSDVVDGKVRFEDLFAAARAAAGQDPNVRSSSQRPATAAEATFADLTREVGLAVGLQSRPLLSELLAGFVRAPQPTERRAQQVFRDAEKSGSFDAPTLLRISRALDREFKVERPQPSVVAAKLVNAIGGSFSTPETYRLGASAALAAVPSPLSQSTPAQRTALIELLQARNTPQATIDSLLGVFDSAHDAVAIRRAVLRFAARARTSSSGSGTLEVRGILAASIRDATSFVRRGERYSVALLWNVLSDNLGIGRAQVLYGQTQDPELRNALFSDSLGYVRDLVGVFDPDANRAQLREPPPRIFTETVREPLLTHAPIASQDSPLSVSTAGAVEEASVEEKDSSFVRLQIQASDRRATTVRMSRSALNDYNPELAKLEGGAYAEALATNAARLKLPASVVSTAEQRHFEVRIADGKTSVVLEARFGDQVVTRTLPLSEVVKAGKLEGIVGGRFFNTDELVRFTANDSNTEDLNGLLRNLSDAAFRGLLAGETGPASYRSFAERVVTPPFVPPPAKSGGVRLQVGAVAAASLSDGIVNVRPVKAATGARDVPLNEFLQINADLFEGLACTFPGSDAVWRLAANGGTPRLERALEDGTIAVRPLSDLRSVDAGEFARRVYERRTALRLPNYLTDNLTPPAYSIDRELGSIIASVEDIDRQSVLRIAVSPQVVTELARTLDRPMSARLGYDASVSLAENGEVIIRPTEAGEQAPPEQRMPYVEFVRRYSRELQTALGEAGRTAKRVPLSADPNSVIAEVALTRGAVQDVKVSFTGNLELVLKNEDGTTTNTVVSLRDLVVCNPEFFSKRAYPQFVDSVQGKTPILQVRNGVLEGGTGSGVSAPLSSDFVEKNGRDLQSILSARISELRVPAVALKKNELVDVRITNEGLRVTYRSGSSLVSRPLQLTEFLTANPGALSTQTLYIDGEPVTGARFRFPESGQFVFFADSKERAFTLQQIARDPRNLAAIATAIRQTPDAPAPLIDPTGLTFEGRVVAPAPDADAPTVTLHAQRNFQNQVDKQVVVDPVKNDTSGPVWEAWKARFEAGEPVGINGRIAPSGGPREAGSNGPMDYSGRSPAAEILRRGRSGAFYAELMLNKRFAAVFREFNTRFAELADLRDASPELKEQLQVELYEGMKKSDPEAFKILLERMETETRERSARYATAVTNAQAPDSATKVYVPVAIIGTGPQGASMATQLKLNDPRMGVLLIDGATSVGGQFSDQGEGFNVNSTSKQTRNGSVSAFGSDIDLNPVHSPVQAGGGQRFNPGQEIGDAACLAAMTSGADILLNRSVLSVTDTREAKIRGEVPGDYAIALSDGSVIYTDVPVIANGLGKPKFPFDANSNALIEAERAKIDYANPEAVPRLYTVRDGFNLGLKSPTGRNPYRAREGQPPPKTIIVGRGDSANTFVEWLGGAGPAVGYTGRGRLDYTELGSLGPVTWLTGADGFDTCDEFFSGNTRSDPNSRRGGRRPRYAAIEGLISPSVAGQRPKVQAQRATFRGVEDIVDGPDKGRVEVVYERFDAGGNSLGLVREIADHVVFATGYNSSAEETLAGVLPRNQQTLRENSVEVRGEPVGYNKVVTVSHRIKDQNVYVLAPALTIEARADNVTDDQNRGLAKAKENIVGLAYNTPRTLATADLIADQVSGDPNKQVTFTVAEEKAAQARYAPEGSQEKTFPVEPTNRPFRMASVSAGADDMRLQSIVREALGRQRIDTTGADAKPMVRVWIELDARAKTATIRVRGLDPEASGRLADRLWQDPWLRDYAETLLTTIKVHKSKGRTAKEEIPAVESIAFEATLGGADATAAKPLFVSRLVSNRTNPAWRAFRVAFGKQP